MEIFPKSFWKHSKLDKIGKHQGLFDLLPPLLSCCFMFGICVNHHHHHHHHHHLVARYPEGCSVYVGGLEGEDEMYPEQLLGP